MDTIKITRQYRIIKIYVYFEYDWDKGSWNICRWLFGSFTGTFSCLPAPGWRFPFRKSGLALAASVAESVARRSSPLVRRCVSRLRKPKLQTSCHACAGSAGSCLPIAVTAKLINSKFLRLPKLPFWLPPFPEKYVRAPTFACTFRAVFCL